MKTTSYYRHTVVETVVVSCIAYYEFCCYSFAALSAVRRSLTISWWPLRVAIDTGVFPSLELGLLVSASCAINS